MTKRIWMIQLLVCSAEIAEETEQNQVFFAKFLMDCIEEDILLDEKVDKDPFDTIEGNTAVCLYDA